MRKSIEYHSHELIFALSLCNTTISTKEHIMNANYQDYKHILICSKDKFMNYKKDVSLRKSNEIYSYILNIRKYIPIVENINYVYLEGKKLVTQKIIDLNKHIDIKQAKADIYVETVNGTFIGFSIKQNKFCTKSNYSVEKMLSESLIDKKEQTIYKKTLSTIRKDLLLSNGINGQNIKEQRSKANALFYDNLENTNPYWNVLKNEIQLNINRIKRELVYNLFPMNIPYDLYEYNGKTFEQLNIDIDNIEFNEHTSYYFDTKGTKRKAAKLFYNLRFLNKEYRVEIRFKGNIWSSSPQFLTHCL